MRPTTVSLSTWTIFLLLLLLVFFASPLEARRTSSRRGKTHGRSYSNRHNTAQSQSQSHQRALQNAPKAPPGSNAASAPGAASKAAAPAPVATAPKAPPAPGTAQNPSNIGWNVNGAQKPVGPPPPYPGMGQNYAHPAGAPPAYSPYAQRPPGYFQGGAGPGYPQQAGHAPQSYNPYMQHGYGGGMAAPPGMGHGMGYGGMAMGGGYGGSPYGGMAMGAGMMPMMGGYQQQKKGSMFSVSNMLAGAALYGLFRSMTSGLGGGYGGAYNNYGPREVHIYDHREHKPSDPNDLKPIMGTVGLPQSVTGEKIALPAKTIEEIAEQSPPPVQNVTVNGTVEVVEDSLPPLPFDNEPKIYFGYGYAFGYQDATVDVVSAVDGRIIETKENGGKTKAEVSTKTPLATWPPTEAGVSAATSAGGQVDETTATSSSEELKSQVE